MYQKKDPKVTVSILGFIPFMTLCILIYCLTITGCSTITDQVDPIVINPPVVQEPSPPTQVPSANKCTHSKALNAPWKNASTSIVIDAYQGNPIDWNKMSADKRMIGVIHRSAQGMRVDTKYVERRAEAKKRGYLWGAYHLGDRSDVKKQADLMLSQTDAETLLILDLEDPAQTKFMTLDQAVEFMKYVYEKTGKVMVVYSNHSVVKQLNTKFPNEPILKKAKFWYARFKPSVTDFPTGIWKGYWLWQFSSEINCKKTGSCLYNVPGTLFDMDVNVFDGSASKLASEWNNSPCL